MTSKVLFGSKNSVISFIPSGQRIEDNVCSDALNPEQLIDWLQSQEDDEGKKALFHGIFGAFSVGEECGPWCQRPVGANFKVALFILAA